jgi:beta-1,4-mannosyltransferase
VKRRSTDKPYQVAFYPSLAQLAGNPYWEMLVLGLKEVGVRVVEESASYKVGWLIRNRKKIDILHLHYFQSQYCNSGKTKARLFYVIRFGLSLLWARIMGYRTVLTNHNLKPTDPLKPNWVDYLGHWVAVNFSERVIVHCKEARHLLAARYGRKKDVFEVSHPNFIDRYPNDISQEAARLQLNLTNNACVFLFFGGVRPNKGIENLIQAFIKMKGEQYRLIIAGNPGNQADYSKDLRNLACDDQRISFYLKFIPDNQLQLFFNASDIVVLPFSRILTSSSAVLAMSFAKPIIVPKIGCLPELLEGDAGWLYAPGNVNSLVETMRTASVSNYDDKGSIAFNKIYSYTIAKFAEQTCECYGIKLGNQK